MTDVQGIILVAFTTLLVVGALSTVARAIDLRRRGRRLPTLLVRDIVVLVGLAWPFVAIAFVRAFALGPLVTGQLWWVLVTSIPPLFAIATYVFYEVAVVGRPRDPRR